MKKSSVLLLLVLALSITNLSAVNSYAAKKTAAHKAPKAAAAPAPEATPAPTPNSPVSIVATVGDDAITTNDLINRTKMTMISSGLKMDEETARKMAPKILQNLINERLQITESDKEGISVTDADIEKGVASIETKNKLPVGQLKKILTEAGVPYSTIQQQVKAQLLWARLKGKKVATKIKISDSEVTDFLKIQMQNVTSQQYHLNEIVLAVEMPSQEQKIKETADELAAKLRAGADFAKVAKQFSQSGTAEKGGQVGWIDEQEIPKEILAEIKKSTTTGQILGPIRSVEGYFLVKIDESRIINSNRINNIVNLKEYTGTAKTKKLLGPDSDAVQACSNPAQFAETNNYELTDHGDVTVKDLPPQLGDIVSNLKTAEFSKPIKKGELPTFFVVCEITENLQPEIDDTMKANARAFLMERKVEMSSRKYMRDLRQQYNIEVRL